MSDCLIVPSPPMATPDFNTLCQPRFGWRWMQGTARDNRSVVCIVEPEREISQVEHVGKDSLIARIWGISPNSYPCLNGHSYDRAVTPEYFKVVKLDNRTTITFWHQWCGPMANCIGSAISALSCLNCRRGGNGCG